mmetsp:Transcript_25988/g.54217  ORF Transcript_25988/g.54217 Transcript_25988/m.54217 type:complete len:214 (+) Transcript_25988:330-971(+)
MWCPSGLYQRQDDTSSIRARCQPSLANLFFLLPVMLVMRLVSSHERAMITKLSTFPKEANLYRQPMMKMNTFIRLELPFYALTADHDYFSIPQMDLSRVGNWEIQMTAPSSPHQKYLCMLSLLHLCLLCLSPAKSQLLQVRRRNLFLKRRLSSGRNWLRQLLLLNLHLVLVQRRQLSGQARRGRFPLVLPQHRLPYQRSEQHLPWARRHPHLV